ncbi:hypothetical protein A7U60_g5131 [Sanghuangporus baumii]|uniref:Uncharacterized protein n=1 Tax=Sanghuangporus baumii TaxID=108892 RepID=A0A9Q5HXG3_SANBA|nr:hypothetical protein A7U60_g5131 [Sanghuangporus baumii]
MPPRPRPRPRPRHRGAAQTQENVENENQGGLGINNKDPGSSLDLGVVDVLRTSTPIRLPPPSRRGRERKPIQRAIVPSTLPPSSPPFAASPLQERLVQDSVEPTEVEDDPFGFFATERRLKQKRDAEQIAKEKREPVLARESDDNGRTPPQPLEDFEPEFELDLSTFVSGTCTPPGHTPDPRAATPRHHHPRQKKFPSTPTSQEEPFSIPQTPSPMKRVSMGPASIPRRPFADVAHLDNSPVKKSNDDITTMTKAAKGKGKKRGGKGGGGRARKKHKTDETFAEEELKGMTEELKELLPSRPKRKAAQRKSVVPVARAAKKSKTKDAKPRSAVRRAKAEEDEGESFVLSGDEREVRVEYS